jgi:hypothetical protein
MCSGALGRASTAALTLIQRDEKADEPSRLP